MILIAILALYADQVCPRLDLAELQPAYAIYEYGAVEPPSMSGLRVTERVGRSESGRFSTVTASTFAGHGSTPANARAVWYALLSAPDTNALRYDMDALAAVAQLSPGEEVQVPVRHIVELPRGPQSVDSITLVRHLGCQTRTVMGEPVEVRAFEVSYQNVTVEGQNVRTTPSSFVREIAPAYGWWVASVSANGTLVLVEVSD